MTLPSKGIEVDVVGSLPPRRPMNIFNPRRSVMPAVEWEWWLDQCVRLKNLAYMLPNIETHKQGFSL